MYEIPQLQVAEVSSTLRLSYIDSFSLLKPHERPPTYQTILAVHGVGFNSAIFSPLIPHLSSTTRFIAYNQRSCTGSSPAYESRAKGGTDVTARYLKDMLEFLEWCIECLELPRKTEAGGGVVVLSWSKGTVIPISLLSLLFHSQVSSLPSNTFLSHLSPGNTSLAESLVSSHLKSLILFEPPGSAFARPVTQDFLDSMSHVLPPHDTTVTRQEWADAFAGWVAAYRPARTDDEERQQLEPSDLKDLDQGLVERGWQWECVDHGFSWSLASEKDAVREIGLGAIRGDLQGRLGVGILYGSRTVAYFEETVEMIRGCWKVDGSANKLIKSVEGTNHFGFVHKPKEFARILNELIVQLE
ncbi:alpha/beta fold hydrolase [Sporobolomyces koalae]|uniref:alpha/beta fold hydrolase n=1 Tax=Sporobolomyces koalae TaxID=500713 RepID=UPI00317915CF